MIHTLQSHKHCAYVVGGCVRDCVLGRTPHDWDICTSATTSEMLEIFKDRRIIETGLQHGTITVVANEEPYEITTYRIDGNYSDSRRPDNVIFTDSLVEDLKRRDFTINAMAYNDEVGLIDPFRGMDDIEQKKIKCVGSAKDRFSEDALRLLRAIRFASQLNFVIETETSLEIHEQCNNLKNISIERINSEFCKIVASNNFCAQMKVYRNVFSLFIPELMDMFEFPQNNPYHKYDVWNHTIHAIENCEDEELIVKLAVLLHDIGKPHSYQDGNNGIRHFKGHGRVSADMADEIMKRMRFDNDTRNAVVQLVYYHDATFKAGRKYIKRWLNKIDELQFRRLLQVRKADIKGQKPDYEKGRLQEILEIETLIEDITNEQPCISLKELAVDGNDVKRIMMLKEGKDVGYWLNIILNKVMDEELKNTKEDLVYYMTGITDGWIKIDK